MERHPPESGDHWLLSYADLITNLLIFFVMLLSAAQISESKMQEIARQMSGQTSTTSLASIQEEIDQQVESEGLEDLVETTLTDDGLELSLNSGMVFSSGEADIREPQVPLLDSMLGTLVPYAKKYRFAIEGHTDTRPITPGGRYDSNWELSTARANAVRHRLQSVGVEPVRIRVEGYADTKALAEAVLKGLSEDARLARHRRVVVRIY
jgi:chemotaxis protein MotB